MKKIQLVLSLTFATILLAGCGPSAAELEKAKQEILTIESHTSKVDSTVTEVKKTSQSLDSLLNQL